MIIVVSKKSCQGCKMTKKILNDKGIEFLEKTMDELSPYEAAEIKRNNYKQLPIVFNGSDSWSGFVPDKVKALG